MSDLEDQVSGRIIIIKFALSDEDSKLIDNGQRRVVLMKEVGHDVDSPCHRNICEHVGQIKRYKF